MVKKRPIPCSLYDIQGLQEWLDEMALQGLFLKDFNRPCDRAFFVQDDPRPVRYRLDPMGKDRKKDLEREELYGQMGWRFVSHISNWYYIFSCDDPEAPELYNDPQSLSIALDHVMQRQVRSTVLFGLVGLLAAVLPLLLDRHRILKELLLWESPQYLLTNIMHPILLLILLPFLFLPVRKILKIRSTLAQGLPLKSKRRWDRPRGYIWYLLLLAVFFLLQLYFPHVSWDVWDLEEAPLSHHWPTVLQLERDRPWPEDVQLLQSGYATTHSSWPAPVQEYSSIDWDIRSPGGAAIPPGKHWTGVRYVQARSLKTAELIFQVELADTSKTLADWAEWTGHSSHIEGSTSFAPWDWPGVDRLEVARYQQHGQDSWTIAVLRGTDILVVNYSGTASPEDCIGLYLDALDL